LTVNWRLALKLLVSVSLLALLFARLGTDAARQVVESASWWLPLTAIVLITFQTVLSAAKWQLLLRNEGRYIGFLSLLKTYLIANFLNLFMPGVIGGDAYRAVRTGRQAGGIAGALPSIVLDRVTGTVALVTVGLMGLTAFVAPQYLAVVAIAEVLVLALGYVLVRGPLRRLFEHTGPDRWFGLSRLLQGVVAALRPSPALLLVIVIALVFQFNTVFINWLYSLLIGIDVPFSKLLLIVPIVYLAEAVPISIGGLGVREGTFTVMFVQLGLPAEQGLMLGLTVSMMRYVAGIVGGGMLALDTFRPASKATES
jgi:uncharacterized membrane protein YbhN (UPF0104 family)